MSVERRLRLLNTREPTPAELPPGMLKVAFASADLRHVDQHFGAAESFVIHAIHAQSQQLVEVVRFGAEAMDGREDKLVGRIAALEGCIAVYCLAVGASAVRQLRACGIQPFKVGPGTPISHQLALLRQELREGPSIWLARAMAARMPHDAKRFDPMETEGWIE
ncbi:MAG: nitrogen fixation protein NifX [Chromatiaceae bacterium]|nr:nitrogen fixation protein NifX [Chromatiaceae bacterium]